MGKKITMIFIIKIRRKSLEKTFIYRVSEILNSHQPSFEFLKFQTRNVITPIYISSISINIKIFKTVNDDIQLKNYFSQKRKNISGYFQILRFVK